MSEPDRAQHPGNPKRKENMRFLPVRAGCILVELDNLDNTLALMDSLRRDAIPGIRELVPAARTVLVLFNSVRIVEPELVASISSRDLAASPAPSGPLIEIPVRYDGEDLSELAAMLNMPESEIVRRHTQPEYAVAFTGFAPGFAYLAGGDPALAVPRRQTPRARVPAGSVGLAGEFSGVYPKDSPGGWQLIGSTPLKMFDLERDPAALLEPGYRVRFIDVSRSAKSVPAQAMSSPPRASQRRPAKAVAHLEVLSTLLPILLQDEGRPGLSGQGVSISGAADKQSYRIANRLVGNAPGTPALEITLGQARFKVTGRAFMAISGAHAPVTVTTPDASSRTVGHHEVVALAGGEIVSVGSPSGGFRSYLAVRGGLEVDPVLGSASRDTLAQIGPQPITAGAQIGILAPPSKAVVSVGEVQPFRMPVAGQMVTLDVTLGPRTDWFTPASVRDFLSHEWQVTPQSSRIGIRLKGKPLERIDKRELPSEATVQGAVQVPASGQPVLFLADHPVTGGYPVIANVAAYHLDLAGQLPPGARLRFNALHLPQM